MARFRRTMAVVAAGAAVVLVAPAALADTVSGQGTTAGYRYHRGSPSLGTISIASSVQVNRDSTGRITKVRGAGRITKTTKAARVQVDRVALGASTGAVVANAVHANAGAHSSVISYTKWVGVAPGSCINYRVRTNYSVRWTDRSVSAFSVLSPLTQVCGSAPPSVSVYANCDAMNVVFPHGVGRPAAVDRTSGTPVTNYYVSSAIYNANAARRDADKDGIACEKR